MAELLHDGDQVPEEENRALADAETPSRGGSQSGVAVDDALDQRDAALERCHELEAALAKVDRPLAPLYPDLGLKPRSRRI